MMWFLVEAVVLESSSQREKWRYNTKHLKKEATKIHAKLLLNGDDSTAAALSMGMTKHCAAGQWE